MSSLRDKSRAVPSIPGWDMSLCIPGWDMSLLSGPEVSCRLWLVLAQPWHMLQLFPEPPCGLSSCGFWCHGPRLQHHILLRETKVTGGRSPHQHSHAGFCEALYLVQLCLPEVAYRKRLVQYAILSLGSTAQCPLPAMARGW